MDALKKLLAGLTLPKTLKGLVWVFSSLYLTVYMSLYVLDSVWLCLPIFGGAFAVCGILLRTVGQLMKSAPQPETALLFMAAVVIALTTGWSVFFPIDGTCSLLDFLLYGSGILSMAGILCLCCIRVLSGIKEEQRKHDEKMAETDKTAETAGTNEETGDIYISFSDYIEKWKKKGASIKIGLKKWEAAAKAVLSKIKKVWKKWMAALKAMLAPLLSEINMAGKKSTSALKAAQVLLAPCVDRGLIVYAILFSGMLVVGKKMSFGGNPYFQPMVFKDFLWIAALFCPSLITGSIFKMAAGKCLKEIQTNEIPKRWWIYAWLLLLVLWSPYLLAYYPGTLSPDSFDSLQQVKNLDTLYNHVPIAYTLLIAFFVRIGWKIGDANFGIFVFSFVQMMIMAGVLSYSAYWVRKKVRYRAVALGILLFYGVNLMVALHSITMWKDILFSGWIVLLCLFLFDMAEDGGGKLEEKKNLFRLGLLFLLISFGRSNGIFVVLLCWIGLLLFYKKIRKKLLFFGGSIILSTVLVQGPGYKLLGIPQAGFAESVGIPLQQICYTVVTDGPLEEKEQEFLENIIPIQTIKENYTPVSADKIKFHPEFDASFLEQNKLGFIKLYLKLLPTHFRAYVQAYLLSTSGFWHSEPVYWFTEENISENDMGIYNVDYFKQYFHFDWKQVVSQRISFLRNGAFVNIGLMVWFVFFYVVMCLSQKQMWKAFLAVPLISCWITLMMATPVNLQFRYVYCYHLMLPIVGIMFFVKRSTHKG